MGGISSHVLESRARQIRRRIVETVYLKQKGHLGGPLSVTDLLAARIAHKLNG